MRGDNLEFRETAMEFKNLFWRRVERRRKYAFATCMKIGDKTILGHCRPDVIHAGVIETKILIFRMKLNPSESHACNVAYFIGGIGRMRMQCGKGNDGSIAVISSRCILRPEGVGVTYMVWRCRNRKIGRHYNACLCCVCRTSRNRSVKRRSVPETTREHRHHLWRKRIRIEMHMRINYREIWMRSWHFRTA